MRWASKLYMDGPGLIKLTLDTIPQMIERVLAEGQATDADIDLYLVHQATHKLLDELRNEMQLDEARMPTVLRQLRQHGLVDHSDRHARAARERPVASRHALAAGRLRRRASPGPAACGPRPGKTKPSARPISKRRKFIAGC